MNETMPPRASMFLRARTFVTAFVLLCVLFVPVPLYAFLYVSITPTAYLFLEPSFFHFQGLLAAWVLLFAFLYIGLFVGLGFLIHRLAARLLQGEVRLMVLLVALVLPFACSFARVLGAYSVREHHGPFTFWETVQRHAERLP